MKIRIPLFALICAVTALPVIRAEDAPKQMPAKEDQTEIGAHMEKMGAAFRKLRASSKDATKNADSLAQLAIIKENAEAALKFKPALTKEKPEAEQAKFVADYQAKMKAFLADVGKLEAALKAGKNEEVAALVATLNTDMSDDHKEFRKQKKKM